MNFAKNGVHNAHLITRAKTILALDRTGKKLTCQHFSVQNLAFRKVLNADEILMYVS
jgi:hypothetical protein